MSDQPVLLFIDEAYSDHRDRALRSLEQLVEIAGWRCEATPDRAAADLIYAPGAGPIPAAAPQRWSQLVEASPELIDGLTIPSCAVLDSGERRFDWVLAAFFFLDGRHELDPAVVQHSRIPGPGIARWGLARSPTVQLLAARVRDLLLSTAPALPTPRPAWPNGKRWALCLTHDCDRLSNFRPVSRIRDTLREARALRLGPTVVSLAKTAYSLVGSATRRSDRCARSWREWIELERELGGSATYYVCTWGRFCPNSDLRDVHYNYQDTALKRTVAELAGSGFEVGLHSSIGVWQHGRVADEVERFERSFGFSPSGFRGHFWSLDPQNPAVSLTDAHRIGGFTHCSALGMNRIAGYRRGVAYPYRPFDGQSGETCGIWEVPPTMMDGAMHEAGPEAGLAAYRSLVENAREQGGVVVLDWHSDSMSNQMQAVTKALVPELRAAANDSSCWITTPGRIAGWAAEERWG